MALFTDLYLFLIGIHSNAIRARIYLKYNSPVIFDANFCALIDLENSKITAFTNCGFVAPKKHNKDGLNNFNSNTLCSIGSDSK